MWRSEKISPYIHLMLILYQSSGIVYPISFSISFLRRLIHDKRDDFDFDIVNFPFLDGDVPHSVFIFLNLFDLL